MGTTVVGSPETIAKGLGRLIETAGGEVGGFMFRAHEWANRVDTFNSFELVARWVIPQFQGSLDAVAASRDWARANRATIFAPVASAIKKAYDDAGREAPEDYKLRLLGARDVKE
jgi:limonene 1,2-monooxygenase